MKKLLVVPFLLLSFSLGACATKSHSCNCGDKKKEACACKKGDKAKTGCACGNKK